jgi:signal peptidase I
MFQRNSNYSLSKSKLVLKKGIKSYYYHKSKLSLSESEGLSKTLKILDKAIYEQNRKEASDSAKSLESVLKQKKIYLPWAFTKEILWFFLILLILVSARQVWFEHYEIPTGSMRPTLREKDHLLVSKLAFGINKPFTPDQVCFNPELVKRLGIVVISSENMDIPNNKFNYLNIFPTYKRLIKRLITKPGDTIYFYGGKIYGINEQNEDLIELRESPFLKKIEYVPLIDFEGKLDFSKASTAGGYFNSVVIKQMNIPIAKLEVIKKGKVSCKALDEKIGNSSNSLYEGLWGMDNYGMVRLSSYSDVKQRFKEKIKHTQKSDYYLEIHHHPGKEFPSPVVSWDPYRGIMRPMLQDEVSLLPLNKESQQVLRDNLFTARFFVEKERAANYSEGVPFWSTNPPKLPGVPDGCYEFYFGHAYSVSSEGYLTLLEEEHPLYSTEPSFLQTLFNYGMRFSGDNTPNYLPKRFTYFREGNLYVLGGLFMDSEDLRLQSFIDGELAISKKDPRYVPFIDSGAPINSDGSINKELILKKGLKVPEKNYLLLGDNHSASGDSREFGFVPENHLRGSPSLSIWPFPQRAGDLPQPAAIADVNIYRCTVWAIVGCVALVFLAQWLKHRKKELLFKD